MALARDRKRINVRGGGVMKIRQIDPTPSDTWLDLGYIMDSKLTDEASIVESIEEAGTFVDAKSGARKVVWETTLKQTTKDEIDLLRVALGSEIYYDVYYKVVLANTKVQEVVVCPAKIKVGPELEFKSATERTLKVTIYGLSPKGAYTRTPAAFNITAEDPLVFIENAAAQNPPSDTAANTAAAVM